MFRVCVMSGFGLVPYLTAGFDFVSTLFRFVSTCFGLFQLCFDFVPKTDRQTDRQTLMCEVYRPQHLPRVFVSILPSYS